MSGRFVSGRLLDSPGVVDPESPGGAAVAGDVAPLGPGVDDVGFDAEAGGDVGDAESVSCRGWGSMSRCWWAEPRARSRQAASTSGGKGMHQRLAGPRRAGRTPALIQ